MNLKGVEFDTFKNTAPYKNLPLTTIAISLPAFTKNFTGTPKIWFIILKLSRLTWSQPLCFTLPLFCPHLKTYQSDDGMGACSFQRSWSYCLKLTSLLAFPRLNRLINDPFRGLTSSFFKRLVCFYFKLHEFKVNLRYI